MLSGKNKTSTTFNCFSPPIMLATFIIEFALFFYVLIRDRFSVVSKLVALILLCLAVFQGAEYSICEGFVLHGDTWSRIGFLAITALPPLGIHLFYEIAGFKSKAWVYAAYGTGLAWFVLFAVYDLFNGFGCNGNYVIFHLKPGFGFFYFIYYYMWLILGVGLTIVYGLKTDNKYKKRALYAGSAGYLAFLLPTTLINLLNPQTTDGIPSIMCGFAVLLALILVFIVLPNYKKGLEDGGKT